LAVYCRFLFFVDLFAALIGGRSCQKGADMRRVFLIWYAKVTPTSQSCPSRFSFNACSTTMDSHADIIAR